MTNADRKKIEQIIYDVYDALDPSKKNSDKYRALFTPMTDAQFNTWLKKFLANDKENFILDAVDFENDVKMDNCEKAAKVLGIPLMETVYMPHLTMDKHRVVASKEKCLVGYLCVKRTQQLLSKKNSLTTSDEHRSVLTNQVTGESKNSRDSDIESAMLTALGADNILKELHGPRSDDMVAKREMNQAIATKGYVTLEELTDLPTNKTTLNTLNTFLLGMGLKSDIVSSTYILPKTSAELFDE